MDTTKVSRASGERANELILQEDKTFVSCTDNLEYPCWRCNSHWRGATHNGKKQQMKGFPNFIALTLTYGESQVAKIHRASTEACLESNYEMNCFFRTGSFDFPLVVSLQTGI